MCVVCVVVFLAHVPIMSCPLLSSLTAVSTYYATLIYVSPPGKKMAMKFGRGEDIPGDKKDSPRVFSTSLR